MDKKSEFSEGDAVRIKRGALASFVGKVIRVDNASERLSVEGCFEGQSDFNLHTLNVSFSIIEKIESTGNSN
jgi:transcription antitermination factor NusG